jgi:hypothetical protein
MASDRKMGEDARREALQAMDESIQEIEGDLAKVN